MFVHTAVDYDYYLRTQKMPTVWCPGCGNGIIVKAFIRAVAALGLAKDEVVVVGGIGCSGRTPFFVDFNSVHTTHGRALAFATGIKLVRPELTVAVVMGDGDSVAIGGNHFIHACRRNIDLTAIIFNNMIYGQTGGQLAPTTLPGRRTTTSMWGNIEPPFDIVQLALGAGAGFVARSTVFDFDQLSEILEQALAFKGFAVVEVLTTCPTYFGRYNSNDDPYDMLHALKDRTDPDEAAGAEKLPVGIFRNEPRPEYTDLYRELVRKLGGGGQP